MRPLRISFPGALFHITMRGDNKENIFLETRDYQRFLQRIEEAKEKYLFRLYAYTLMRNHFHLLTEEGNGGPISKIMQSLNTGHTMYFHKKYGRIGHIFQGRFLSLLVEKEAYLLELTRYIHLNPVRAGIVTKPEEYKWSSYRAYLGLEKNPLVDKEKEEVLNYFSQNKEKQVKEYQDFVEVEVKKPTFDLASQINQEVYLASEEFIERLSSLRGQTST